MDFDISFPIVQINHFTEFILDKGCQFILDYFKLIVFSFGGI